MKDSTLNVAKEHALREYPRESCGIVVVIKGKEKYFSCRNDALTPSEHFIISPRDYADAEDLGKVVCIVHSHPDHDVEPSQADRVSCEASEVPWLVIAVHKDAGELSPIVVDTRIIKPEGYEADLIGREFSYGTLDCWTLVQDWFQRERGIDLAGHDTRDGWWERGEDWYMKNYKDWGFIKIDPDDLQEGDLILMQIRSPVANHAAVYIGNTQIIHHLYGRLSSRDVYGGYWREVTRATLRYVGEKNVK